MVNLLGQTVEAALSSLVEGEGSDEVDSEVAGDMVVNIGLGFGFDLIDGRVEDDREGIAQHQARLVWVETKLDQFIDTDGAIGSLAKIFGIFMGKSV